MKACAAVLTEGMHEHHLGNEVTKHVAKFCLEHSQQPEVLAEPHGPECVPDMGCDIPQKLQAPSLFGI